MTRKPITYPNVAKSAFVSSSGCAGACMKVPATFNLRIASPSATCPSSLTIEKFLRFCASSPVDVHENVTDTANPARAARASTRFLTVIGAPRGWDGSDFMSLAGACQRKAPRADSDREPEDDVRADARC